MRSISTDLSQTARDRRLKALNTIYLHYDRVNSKTGWVCHEGCSRCCTRNVVLTSVEAEYILAEYRNRPDIPVCCLSGAVSEPRFIPVLTTNRLAELCRAGRDIPEETMPDDSLPCPFLSNDRCRIYPVRPFACRCMNSLTPCSESGFADQSDWVVALNTLYLQLIEHLDGDGWSGNLIDMLHILDQPSMNSDDSRQFLVKNQPVEMLVVPPEYRDRMTPIVQELWAIISPAVAWHSRP